MEMQMQIAPQVGCCEAVGLAFKNYTKCSGRSRRSEFWYFLLFFYCIDFLLYFLYSFISYRMNYVFISIYLLFYLVLFIPFISLSVRRLHDTGQSGFLALIFLIPIIGWLILLFYCCPDSEQNTNEYGPSPKYISTQNDPLNPNDSAYGVPVNPYPQPMPPQVSPYPQPNQMPPQVSPYPQPNQMPPQVYPYPQPNQMQPQLNPYPQVDPQISPNPQIPPPQDFDP